MALEVVQGEEVEVAHVKIIYLYFLITLLETMTGLKRFILYGGIISLAYILSLFKYVKIPLVNQEYADITLPFVSYSQ